MAFPCVIKGVSEYLTWSSCFSLCHALVPLMCWLFICVCCLIFLCLLFYRVVIGKAAFGYLASTSVELEGSVGHNHLNSGVCESLIL